MACLDDKMFCIILGIDYEDYMKNKMNDNYEIPYLVTSCKILGA